MSAKIIAELLKQLEERLAKVDRSDLMELLKARVKHHHNYSFTNTLIAGIQLCRQQGRPLDLETFSNLWLAPFPVWSRWGYRIMRGAKALNVLTPIRYRRKVGEAATVAIKSEYDEVEENERHRVYFVTKPVFDISQTEKPVKDQNLAYRDITLKQASLSFMELLGRVYSAGLKVEFIPLRPDCGGYILEDTITVNSHNSTAAQYGTLLHELGHHFLGHTEAKKQQARSIEELEAESVAFVVGNMLGVEMPSELYIAAWGGDGKAVVRSLANIDRAARNVIKTLGIMEFYNSTKEAA